MFISLRYFIFVFQNVLGELQLSFLCFLIGQQFDSFDQWKKLTALLCGNQSSIAKYEDMYTELVQILHFQVCPNLFWFHITIIILLSKYY